MGGNRIFMLMSSQNVFSGEKKRHTEVATDLLGLCTWSPSPAASEPLATLGLWGSLTKGDGEGSPGETIHWLVVYLPLRKI